MESQLPRFRQYLAHSHGRGQERVPAFGGAQDNVARVPAEIAGVVYNVGPQIGVQEEDPAHCQPPPAAV